MANRPELIVMLTYDDMTVANARELFDACKNSGAKFWGFKEKPLPPREMKDLFAHMKRCGKTTVLEVVAYTEDECVEGARLAADCGCDILMGTTFSDSVLAICRENGIKYMPFVGEVTGRPSVLDGTADRMIAEAKEYLARGADGFDLLGYRFTGDASELIARFVGEIPAPVCVAGSVNSFERLDELAEISPWAFTVGSAFFDRRFGDAFADQIDRVYEYINK